MAVDPQHHAIDDDGSEAREEGVAFGYGKGARNRRGRTSWNAAPGRKGLESQEQPVRIVRDVENEGLVGREAQRHLRALQVVAGHTIGKAREGNEGEEDPGESPMAGRAHGQI